MPGPHKPGDHAIVTAQRGQEQSNPSPRRAIDVTMTIYASVSLQDKREALRKLTDELG
ncbi:hypothetical protein AB0I60_11585 [Actinosynnema sp. NPDC050436]|uniref:hypothetical protein n=1 Tax=Actinosynnema sp. NPDC050436 TaxID=3155659 RepID=UPI00341127EF